MERLFRMAGVKYQTWYNNVTIDPPELVQFIKQQYPEVRWNNPKMHLTHMIKNKSPGPPTRRIRWCCEIYKEQGGKGAFKAIGVRADESPRRKGMWSIIGVRDKYPIMSPILYWTTQDIWSFIREQGMVYCSLYDEGFSRLGCVGCPMGSRRSVEFARWPKYEILWRRGALQWWEKYKELKKKDGSSYFAAKFKTFDEYWSWWMEEKNINDTDGPDCQMWLW